MSAIIQLLKRHEGTGPMKDSRFLPYQDTVSKWTIGFGRNLSDVGLSADEVDLLLSNDVDRVRHELDEALPWWAHLDGVRRDVLLDLGFNLGVLTPPGEAKLPTFTRTLGLIEAGEYDKAADALLQSKWATQVGKQPGQRAHTLTTMLRTGEYPAWVGA